MHRAFPISVLVLVLASLCGCSTSQRQAKSPVAPEEDLVTVSLQHPKIPQVELRALKDRADQSDGEAAFKLWAYFSFSVESDASLARRYYDRSIALEYPAALYDKAFWEWCREPVPNIDRVERLLRRAISLGFKDEKHLLDEVLEAKKSGVIPSHSPFRLFPEKPEPNKRTTDNSGASPLRV